MAGHVISSTWRKGTSAVLCVWLCFNNGLKPTVTCLAVSHSHTLAGVEADG